MIEAVAPQVVRRAQRVALVVGIVGAVLCAVGWLVSPTQFFWSYLFGYVFWTSIGVGSLGILMLAHLTGGSWGAASRRIFESATQTLLLMAVLFIPILFGLPILYPWAQADVVAADPLLQHKLLYLNAPFFVVRTVAYFVIWIVLAYHLSSLSTAQDRDPDPAGSLAMRRISAGGLVAFALTLTFAAMDWVMSLEPDWYSTVFSSIVVIGSMVTAFAMGITVLALLRTRAPLDEVTSPQQLSDVGSMAMSFLLLWAYLQFSQFMLIWAGNLPEEITWYVHRTTGGFAVIAWAMVLFAFAVPFVALFSTQVRHSARLMAAVGIELLAAHLLSMFWLVRASFTATNFHVSWLDVVAPIAIGGLWVAVFLWRLERRPLVPLHDPRFVLEPEPQHG